MVKPRDGWVCRVCGLRSWLIPDPDFPCPDCFEAGELEELVVPSHGDRSTKDDDVQPGGSSPAGSSSDPGCPKRES